MEPYHLSPPSSTIPTPPSNSSTHYLSLGSPAPHHLTPTQPNPSPRRSHIYQHPITLAASISIFSIIPTLLTTSSPPIVCNLITHSNTSQSAYYLIHVKAWILASSEQDNGRWLINYTYSSTRPGSQEKYIDRDRDKSDAIVMLTEVTSLWSVRVCWESSHPSLRCIWTIREYCYI